MVAAMALLRVAQAPVRLEADLLLAALLRAVQVPVRLEADLLLAPLLLLALVLVPLLVAAHSRLVMVVSLVTGAPRGEGDAR